MTLYYLYDDDFYYYTLVANLYIYIFNKSSTHFSLEHNNRKNFTFGEERYRRKKYSQNTTRVLLEGFIHCINKLSVVFKTFIFFYFFFFKKGEYNISVFF